MTNAPRHIGLVRNALGQVALWNSTDDADTPPFATFTNDDIHEAVMAERDRLRGLLSDLVSATREFVYGEGYVVDLEECGLNAATDYLFEGDDDD